MASKKKTSTKSTTAVREKVAEAFGNTWTRVLESSRADVQAVEDALGVAFPDDLVRFLQSCANGRPTRNYYFDKKHQVEVGLGRVLPLRDQPKAEGIVTVATTRRRATALPKGLIPFGFDTGNSDTLCVDTQTGHVVYWVHDTASDERGKIVADSLKVFLEGLAAPPY